MLLGPSPAGRPKISRVNSLSLAAREGVSTEHLHAEGGHARLLRGGCASSEGAGPVYPSSPRTPRLQKRGPAGQTDQPQRVPRNPAPSRRGGRESAEDPGPIAVHQGPSCPRCAGPTVNTRPSRRSPCGGDHRVRPALAEAAPKPAEAAIVIDFLASRGRRRV